MHLIYHYQKFFYCRPHHYGVECLDITPDGKYIVSVSKEVNNLINWVLGINFVTIYFLAISPITIYLYYIITLLQYRHLILPIIPQVDDRKQEITIFEWKNPDRSKIISHPVPLAVSEDKKAKEYIKHVIFNPEQTEEFATTANKRLLFWTWEKGA